MVTVAHPTPHAKRHLDRSSRFATIYPRDQQTDSQTMNIASNRSRLYAMHIRCGLKILRFSNKHRLAELIFKSGLAYTETIDMGLLQYTCLVPSYEKTPCVRQENSTGLLIWSNNSKLCKDIPITTNIYITTRTKVGTS